jgi:RPA family protein
MASTPTREVARRVFAREFNDATHTFKESDDDRAPLYALLPTGERVNRVFVVGTLTETDDVGEDSEYWQGRIVDPTGGTYFTYAGQYQPDAASMLRDLEPPEYVAVVGKPRTFETDSGDVNVSIRPESITAVDETTRNRWVVETAERTIERIQAVDEDDDYVQLARAEYDLPVETYRQVAVEALESLDAERAESVAD